jgi:hypothetical protein
VQYNSPRAIARTSASGAPLKTKNFPLSSNSIPLKMQRRRKSVQLLLHARIKNCHKGRFPLL